MGNSVWSHHIGSKKAATEASMDNHQTRANLSHPLKNVSAFPIDEELEGIYSTEPKDSHSQVLQGIDFIFFSKHVTFGLNQIKM